jgi:hypothetical protein
MHIQNMVLNTALLFTSKQNCPFEAYCVVHGSNTTLTNTAHATFIQAPCRQAPFEFHNIFIKV